MQDTDLYSSKPQFYDIVDVLVTVPYWDKYTKFSIALTAVAYWAREVCRLKSLGYENSAILGDAIKRVCGHLIMHHKVVEEGFEGVKQTMFAVMEYQKQAASGALEAESRILREGASELGNGLKQVTSAAKEIASGDDNCLRQVSSDAQRFLRDLATKAQMLIKDETFVLTFCGAGTIGVAAYAYFGRLGPAIAIGILSAISIYYLARRADQDVLLNNIKMIKKQAKGDPDVMIAAAAL